MAAPRTSFLDLAVVDSSDDNTDDDGDEPVRGFLIIAPDYAQGAQGARVIQLGHRPRRARFVFSYLPRAKCRAKGLPQFYRLRQFPQFKWLN